MRGRVLAVDLGKTGCRAVLVSGARREAQGPGSPGLAAPDGAALACAAILAVARPLLAGPLDAVCVGAAGALAAPGAAMALARLLFAGLPVRAAAVASDAVTSHAGALGGGPGVVLAVGTGAVALGIGPDGAMHRADGAGPWLGDEGGGAWIGLHGLRAALRAADGRGPATALLAASARLGPPGALPGLVEGHPNPPRFAAAFAGDVARAATTGDAVAGAIMGQAVAALAGSVRAAAARLAGHGPVQVAVTGGLLGLGPALAEPLGAALRALPGVEPVPARGTALDGALLLASNRCTAHERHTARAGA